MTRYEIPVPLADNEGNPRPDYLEQAEHLLELAGFEGRRVDPGPHRGVWRQYVDPCAVIYLDAADADLPKVKAVAEILAERANQEAVYFAAFPGVEVYLISAPAVRVKTA